MMDIYNHKALDAIREEYKRCAKEQVELRKQYIELWHRHQHEKDYITYREYQKLEHDIKYLENKMIRIDAELNTWDKAREICMNIADEVFGDEHT